MTKDISFIIPCYNESKKVLQETIKSLESAIKKSLPVEYEIIIVDDGSQNFGFRYDRKKSVKVIRHPKNRGYGAAIKTGIKNARYDWIGITDADGTYPNERFDELLWYTEDYDMVIGARRWNDIPLVRRWPKKVLTIFASFLSGESIPDLNSGMRIFKKRLAKKFWHLYPDSFSFTSTITMAMQTNDLRIKFHEIEYHKRIGKSSIQPVKDTVRFFLLVIRLALYFNPKKFFLPLSIIFGFLAFFRGIRDYIVAGSLGGVTLILFFMSFQIFFFGLLAEIINKTRLYLSQYFE